MAFPICQNFNLGLVVGDQLDVKLELAIDVAVGVEGQGALEQAHLVDAYDLILPKSGVTTLRMMNFRVMKLLSSSMLERLLGSMVLRSIFCFFSG